MTVKWALLALLQYELLAVTQQSIAGVTYMDHFDFEERYRDVNECNPFHWHPLHMPEHCADMYEKLIRSRIAKNTPVRIFRNKEKMQKDANGYIETDAAVPMYELDSQETHQRRSLSPYEKMLDMMKKDVLKEPSAPSVQLLPGVGPVAIYRQPISSKTELMIKQIATAYAKAGQQSYVDNAPSFLYPQQYLEHNSDNETVFNIENVKRKINVHHKKKGKISTKHMENGGVITIIKSKHRPHKKHPKGLPIP